MRNPLLLLLMIPLALMEFFLLHPEAFSAPTQDKLWAILKQVKWEERYHEEFKTKVPYPIFTPKIKALQGTQITIRGYVVPLTLYGGDAEDYFILSSLPPSSCFFCGGGGPETVMEVYLKNPGQGKSLQSVVTLQGRLKLNAGNYDHLIYILEEATVVSR